MARGAAPQLLADDPLWSTRGRLRTDSLGVMWVVLIDPAAQANWSDWPDKRVFGPFSRHMDAERVAFEMNEGFQEDRVAKAVEVLPASAAPKVD